MTRWQALRRIILPQAFVAMIPPWGNLFIELLKSTALVSLITMSDLTFKAKTLNDFSLKTIPIFSLALLIYLVLSLVITIGMRRLERLSLRGMARGRGH
jgi:polar amino acid transport system permease protein